MPVEATIQAPPLGEYVLRFARDLTDDEISSLREILGAEECKLLFGEGDAKRYGSVVVNRREVRWYPKSLSANKKIVSTIKAFAAKLPDEAPGFIPEKAFIGGGEPLSRRLQ